MPFFYWSESFSAVAEPHKMIHSAGIKVHDQKRNCRRERERHTREEATLLHLCPNYVVVVINDSSIIISGSQVNLIS